MEVQLTFEKGFDKLYSFWEREYPEALSILGVSRERLDYSSMSRQYFSDPAIDFSIDKNANTNNARSPALYQSEITKPLLKLHGLFLLWKKAKKLYGTKRANELLTAIVTGDVYFHDLSGMQVQIPYCVSISAKKIAEDGMPFNAQLRSQPPKHADSFVSQVVETMFNVGNQTAGAVAVPDFLPVLSTFTKKDGLSDRDIRQLLQKCVFSLNQSMRGGVQSLFSNFSIYDNDMLKSTLGCEENWDLDEVHRVQRVYAEFISEGVDGVPYKFPVSTANLALRDQKFLDALCEWNEPLGIWNIYVSQQPKLCFCCRLQIDPVELRQSTFFNTFGSGDVNTGSTRVVTLNLPRVALKKGDFFENLESLVSIAHDLLYAHRMLLEERIQQHFLPFFDYGLMSLDRMFSTFGIVGLYESAKALPCDGLKSRVENMKTIAEFIERRAREYTKRDKVMYNVEQIPAEQAAFTLSRLDNLLYNTNNGDAGYSNQMIPLNVRCTMKERIDYTSIIDSSLSGGGILHLNIGEKVPRTAMKRLISYTGSRVSYFAINFILCKCNTCGTSFAGTGCCPRCGETLNVTRVTRVVGYFSPLNSWSAERLRELSTRQFYSSDASTRSGN